MDRTDYVMAVSRNGQVSIPAAVRARWHAKRMIVIDMGDHLVMRPASDDPIGELRGVLAGRGPSSDEMRRQAREEDAEYEARRGW